MLNVICGNYNALLMIIDIYVVHIYVVIELHNVKEINIYKTFLCIDVVNYSVVKFFRNILFFLKF